MGNCSQFSETEEGLSPNLVEWGWRLLDFLGHSDFQRCWEPEKMVVSTLGVIKKKACRMQPDHTNHTMKWIFSGIDKNMHVGRLYLLDDCMKCYMWQSICIPIYIHTNIHSYIHIDWRFLVLPFPNILWCTSRQFSSLVQDRPVVGPMPFWLVLAGNDPQISLLDVFAHIWDSDKAFMFFFFFASWDKLGRICCFAFWLPSPPDWRLPHECDNLENHSDRCPAALRLAFVLMEQTHCCGKPNYCTQRLLVYDKHDLEYVRLCSKSGSCWFMQYYYQEILQHFDV